jgi:pyruvate dehydrogenase E2 component (dihydrolipoamide acetyltransferase)
MAEVRMPKMGDGMEEGRINAWLKREGDMVTAGDVIAEIETDKASVEITAYDTGILSKILVPEGGTVPVGEAIAVIGAASAKSAAQAPAAPKAVSEPVPAPAAAVAAPAPHAQPVTNERVKASPLARRIAAELGIDLATVSGTGPGGRVVERDVKSLTPTAVSLPSPAAAAIVAPVVASVPVGAADADTAPTDIKPSRMREAIAKRVVTSKQTVPHFYVTMKVGMDKALSVLKEMNADTPESKVTVNDLIVKACAVALKAVPEVNSSWTAEGTIRRYSDVHIGVAVGIEEGLIIPVVRHCESKTLRQISVDARALIKKARTNQLKPEEYQGGTFTVSNLGMMGVDEFIAIVNPPEAAILAIGGVVREPVVLDGSDEIVIRSNMKITISADHRLLDGVSAAKFVQEVKKALEAPYSLLA